MLPFPTHIAGKEICGARFDSHVHALPFVALFPAKAKLAGSKERNTDNLFEYGAVSVPADAGASGILIDEDMLD